MKNTANDFRFNFSQADEITIPTEVRARKGRKKVWPVLQGIAIVKVEIPGEGVRDPHLHTNANELSIIIKGSARAGIINPYGERLEFDLAEGECVYFPQGWPHWLINTSKETLISYFNYSHEEPVTIEVKDISI